MELPLTGVRVFDLSTNVAGAYVAKLFAQFGAEITLVEPPVGAALRHEGPFVDGIAGAERSLLFAWAYAGARSITLDLDAHAGQEALRDALEGADVLIDTAPVGFLEARGLDQAALEPRFPRLVCTSVLPFGSDGPYAGFAATPAVLHALGGWVHTMGDPAREPAIPGPSLGLFIAALFAATGTLEALRLVPEVGGQAVEVSVMEAIAATMLYDHVSFQYRGIERRRTGRRFLPGDPLQGLFPCRDGWCGIQAPLSWMWRGLCDLIGRPELVEDPRFRTPEGRSRNKEELDAILCGWAAEHDADEIYHVSQARRLPFHPVLDAAGVYSFPHLLARDYWDTVTVEGRDFQVPGLPFRWGALQEGRNLGAVPVFVGAAEAMHA